MHAAQPGSVNQGPPGDRYTSVDDIGERDEIPWIVWSTDEVDPRHRQPPSRPGTRRGRRRRRCRVDVKEGEDTSRDAGVENVYGRRRLEYVADGAGCGGARHQTCGAGGGALERAITTAVARSMLTAGPSPSASSSASNGVPVFPPLNTNTSRTPASRVRCAALSRQWEWSPARAPRRREPRPAGRGVGGLDRGDRRPEERARGRRRGPGRSGLKMAKTSPVRKPRRPEFRSLPCEWDRSDPSRGLACALLLHPPGRPVASAAAAVPGSTVSLPHRDDEVGLRSAENHGDILPELMVMVFRRRKRAFCRSFHLRVFSNGWTGENRGDERSEMERRDDETIEETVVNESTMKAVRRTETMRRSRRACALHAGRTASAGSVRNFVCEAVKRVGAVGNRGRCGFPSRGGRVRCVHGDGSVHARVHSTLVGAVKRSPYTMAN